MNVPVTHDAIVLCKWHPQFSAEVLRRGENVYVVLDAYDIEHAQPDWTVLEEAAHVYRISTFDALEDLGAVAVDLSLRGAKVSRVLSFTELSVYGAGYLEQALRGGPDSLRHAAHRDKRLMKQRVADAGVPVARFRSLTSAADEEGIESVLTELRFPVVVKSAAGFGTMSTIAVHRPEDLRPALKGLRFEPLLRTRQLIVEEFVEGPEVCADGTWSNGQELTFAIHPYYVNRLNAIGGVGVDGSHIVREKDDPGLYARMRSLQAKVNEALGITDGPTHMEVFLQPDGELVFSEIATRVGGGPMPLMLSAHFGCDIWSLHAEAAVSGSCGELRLTDAKTGAVHLRPEKPGIITRFPDDDELAAHPNIVAWQRVMNVGDRVTLSHQAEWIFYVILQVAGPEEYDALVSEIASTFRVETRPDEGPGPAT